MKTDFVMIRQDLPVRQKKNGHFSVNSLNKIVEDGRKSLGWKNRGQVQDIIAQKENSERIYYVLKETGAINSDFSEFMEMVSENGMVKVLKKLGCYKTTGRGANRDVWCNPYVWTLAAMEMNPMLFAKTVIWLTDRLIESRIAAGDMYKELSKSASRLQGVDYAKLSRALNIIVFGRHEAGIRNTGTEKELEELHRLEQNLTYSIEAGFIRSFEELMSHLRAVWHKKQHSQSAIS